MYARGLSVCDIQAHLREILAKRLVERAMDVELTEYLGYERGQSPPGGADNTRNGSTAKTLMTEHGPVWIDTPRDRDSAFEPKVVRKRQRRFEGFDEKIIALLRCRWWPRVDQGEIPRHREGGP